MKTWPTLSTRLLNQRAIATTTTWGIILTYFKTKAQAQQLADQLNYADVQGFTYRVQASRGGFYVAVFDQDYHHQGNI